MIERHVFSASQTSGFCRYRSPAIKPPPNHAFNRTVSGGVLRRRRHGRLTWFRWASRACPDVFFAWER